MPESNNKSEIVSYQADYFDRTYNKIVGSDNTARSVTNLGKVTRFRNGVKLPNWRDIVRNGQNATTPLTGSDYDFEYSYVTAGEEQRRLSGGGVYWSGAEYYGYPGYPNIWASSASAPASVVTSVTNRCIRKFLDKAEAVRSSVEAGQDFGEYRETLHGMISPLGELRKHVLGYFPKVKKLRNLYKDAASLTKALADTYLEWTFGWKPLVSDIAQAYVGLQNRNRFGERQAIRVSATDNFPITLPTTYNLSSFGGFGLIQITYRVTGKYTVVMYGMIRTGVGTDGSVSRAQVLQLDLPHFVPTIWDLIPYSFIVDYFVNVGEIIRALSTIDSVFVWGGQDFITSRVQEFSDIVAVLNPLPPNAQVLKRWARGGHARFTNRDISRSILVPSGLIPKVQLTLPLSSKPWENMGAILASRIAGLVPL
jgi:hypothetical protein